MAYNQTPNMHPMNNYVLPHGTSIMVPPVYLQPVIPNAVPSFSNHMIAPTVSLNLPPVPLPPLERLPVPSSQRGLNPTTTVFVGNINENAPDLMMRNILGKIGNIVSWKRVQGLNGKLQAFGFCEFDDPEATLRALRLLHSLDIGGKKLLVKVDAKSKEKLRDYKFNKKRENMIGGQYEDTIRPVTIENNDEEEFYNEELFKLDVNAVKRDNNIVFEIKKILKDNAAEFEKIEFDELTATKDKLSRTQRSAHGPLDAEKTEVISKEILRFKENNLRDEKYREKIREKGREKREKERHRRPSPRRSEDEENERLRKRHRSSRSDSHGSLRGSRKHKSPEKESQPRDESKERKEREERREREEREKQKRMEQETKEEEEREKAYERRRLERKLKEKEASYQEQLKLWESREQKKIRDQKKRKEYEKYMKDEEMMEAKKLREFLEDYMDERDDAKYYKAQFLARRLKEREKEMETDLKDRQKEKEEIEEIKARLATEGHPNLHEEIAKLEQNRSKHLKPQLKIANGKTSPKPESGDKRQIDVIIEESISPISKKDKKRHKSEIPLKSILDTKSINSTFNNFIDVPSNNINNVSPPRPITTKPDKLAGGDTIDGTENVPLPPDFGDAETNPAPPGYKPIGFRTSAHLEKKSNAIFNAEEEEEKAPKIKLSILEDGSLNDESKKGNLLEDKRQAIKKLIEKIPTNKAKLFAFVIEWDLVDTVLMEKRIKPWINKKIIEYIGEEEPTLVEFICSKLLNRNEPQSILDDILMVLDEEAEVFIVKLWRLLIYEIEAKKSGLLKPSE